jgi:hypothetical protein
MSDDELKEYLRRHSESEVGLRICKFALVAIEQRDATIAAQAERIRELAALQAERDGLQAEFNNARVIAMRLQKDREKLTEERNLCQALAEGLLAERDALREQLRRVTDLLKGNVTFMPTEELRAALAPLLTRSHL